MIGEDQVFVKKSMKSFKVRTVQKSVVIQRYVCAEGLTPDSNAKMSPLHRKNSVIIILLGLLDRRLFLYKNCRIDEVRVLQKSVEIQRYICAKGLTPDSDAKMSPPYRKNNVIIILLGLLDWRLNADENVQV